MMISVGCLAVLFLAAAFSVWFLYCSKNCNHHVSPFIWSFACAVVMEKMHIVAVTTGRGTRYRDTKKNSFVSFSSVEAAAHKYLHRWGMYIVVGMVGVALCGVLLVGLYAMKMVG